MSKKFGGLRVQQMKKINMALLVKWCWMCLVDKEGLWFTLFVFWLWWGDGVAKRRGKGWFFLVDEGCENLRWVRCSRRELV